MKKLSSPKRGGKRLGEPLTPKPCGASSDFTHSQNRDATSSQCDEIYQRSGEIKVRIQQQQMKLCKILQGIKEDAKSKCVPSPSPSSARHSQMEKEMLRSCAKLSAINEQEAKGQFQWM